jgi:hypothetical protein
MSDYNRVMRRYHMRTNFDRFLRFVLAATIAGSIAWFVGYLTGMWP